MGLDVSAVEPALFHESDEKDLKSINRLKIRYVSNRIGQSPRYFRRKGFKSEVTKLIQS